MPLKRELGRGAARGAVALMIVMRNPLEGVLGVGVVLLGYPLY